MATWLWVFWLGCGAPETTPPPPTLHTVMRGETLAVIAKQYQVDIDELVEWNHLASPDRIEVGQELSVGNGEKPRLNKQTPKKKSKRHRVKTAEVSVEAAPSGTWPKLKKPAVQACLGGPKEISADEGMAASEGLSEDQVRTSMSTFLDQTVRCLSDGVTPQGTLLLEITVGCNGTVSGVTIEDLGEFPPDVGSCIADVLAYAPFPAHDQPDGYVFGFPLHFSY